MTYAVKEIFYTLQGEGANTGRPAVFLRFAGCNLWSGREQDRSSAVCQFCDTDFVGGTKFATAELLAEAVANEWLSSADPVDPGAPPRGQPRFVVCTGGEPLLQLDRPLIDALHAHRFEIAVETNGTIEAPAGLDWICVSPKADAPLVQMRGDELKVVYPQAGLDNLHTLENLAFRHFFVQPMDGPDVARNTELAARYCLAHPRWRLSLQTHKLLGIR
jgi:7-carboxy-7-deazaguanine synthase